MITFDMYALIEVW